jgi:natural product biosynthesis luciferase-like monooxygenase protein
MVTDRIQIRSASVVLPLQNPIRIAEEWSVVDNLSKGRVAVSFASGWQVNDFVLSPANYTNRKEIMFKGIQTIHDLWQGKMITLLNGAGNEVSVRIFPRPLQPKLPVWLSCQSNETFTRAGEFGANVVTSMFLMPIDELAGKIKLYRNALERSGHNADEGQVAVNLHTFIGEDLETVREKVKGAYVDYLLVNLGLHATQAKGVGAELDLSDSDKEFMTSKAIERLFNERGLVGTVSTCYPKVEALKSIGVDEIACLIDFGIDCDSVMASLYHLNKLKEVCNAQQELVASTR